MTRWHETGALHRYVYTHIHTYLCTYIYFSEGMFTYFSLSAEEEDLSASQASDIRSSPDSCPDDT